MPRCLEAKREYARKYAEENKEARREYNRKYIAENKEKSLAKAKQFYQENKEKILEEKKKYRQENPKKMIIQGWKRQGIIGDYDEIYERYLRTNECEMCGSEMCYGLSGDARTADHDHETGELRAIICRRCNSRRK